MFPQIFFLFRFISALNLQRFPEFYDGLFLVLFWLVALATPSDITRTELTVALNCDDTHSNRLHEKTLNLERAGPDHQVYASCNKTKQTVLIIPQDRQILISEASALLTSDDVVLGAAAGSHSTAMVCVSGFISALDLAIANARIVHFNPFHADMSFLAIKCYAAPMMSSNSIIPIFSKSTENWMSSCNSNNADNGNITKVLEYGSDLSGCTSVSMPASSTVFWKSHSLVCRRVSKLLAKTQDGKCLSV